MTTDVLNNLDLLVREPAAGFERAFAAMAHPQKERARGLLIYLDKALDFLLERESADRVKGNHLHLPIVIPEQKKFILEYLILKLFFRAMTADAGSSDYLRDKITALSHRLERNQIPENASAINGGNREYKKWKGQWQRLVKQRAFLRGIPDPDKDLAPAVIVNGQQNDLLSMIDNLFITDPDRLSDWRSYVLLNEAKFNTLISGLAKIGVLQGINTVMLFDYDGRNIFNGCDLNMLDKYHNSGIEIKDLIVVTFSREVFRLKQQISRCTSVYRRYFNRSQPSLGDSDSHVFERREFQQLLNLTPSRPSIHWLGDRHSSLETFLELVQSLDIRELKTIHAFNLFMMAMSPAITDRILDDLFNNAVEDGLFRLEVREQILTLSDEQRTALKAVTLNLLNYIEALWQSAKHIIIELAAGQNAALIVPLPLVEDRLFASEMGRLLGSMRFTTYSWRDMKMGNINSPVIITLNYKDTGRYPFEVFPSVFEHELPAGTKFHAIFVKTLFSNRFHRCSNEYSAAQNAMLKDAFRKQHFDWHGYHHSIHDSEEDIFEDVNDQEYDMHDPAELIKVTYPDGEHSSFYPSKQLIIGNEKSYTVIRADQLSDKDLGSAIQPLDDIHEDLNLFAISREEESELARIKQDLGVRDHKAVLWKVLLKGKLSSEISDQHLYDIIATTTGDPEFVRYQHFKNKWLDPGSELLIPRKRRHFRSVCEYLDLPPSYYRLKLKKRASMTQNTRQSNQRKNRLLAQMFNEGSFDSHVDWSGRTFDHLLEPHDLEEHGITEDNVNREMRALIDLLAENINTRTIQKIERP